MPCLQECMAQWNVSSLYTLHRWLREAGTTQVAICVKCSFVTFLVLVHRNSIIVSSNSPAAVQLHLACWRAHCWRCPLQISGARVKLHPPSSPGSTDRCLEINGSILQVQAAQALTQAFLLAVHHPGMLRLHNME